MGDAGIATVRLTYKITPATPQTWDYPGDPAMIEDVDVYLISHEERLRDKTWKREELFPDALEDLEQNVYDTVMYELVEGGPLREELFNVASQS